LAAVITGTAKAAPATRIIGYFDAKSQKELPVESIPYANLTHVVLANALKVDSAGQLHLRPAGDALELSAEELIQRLAKKPVRLVVSIRGHEDDVALDELAEVDDARLRFASELATRVRDWGADGAEIEWHSDDPAGGKAATAPFDVMEQYHFALLCRDLAGALRAAGEKTLSVAVRPGRQEFAEGAFVRSYIDWLALRAYSMRSLGDPHHSSLKDMAVALHEWRGKGVPSKQLVLGTPLFARPGAALFSAGDRNEALRMPWRELIALGRLRSSASSALGDLFVDEHTGKAWWASGLNTTRAKVAHILKKGYGGIALRDLHHDARLGEGPSLVQAAADVVRQHSEAKERNRTAAVGMSLFQRGLKRSRTEGAADMEARDEF